MALQALALYSTLVFSPKGASTVTVQSPSGEVHLFDVNNSNKLVYQQRALQDVSGKYSLEVEGSACVSVQVSGAAPLLVLKPHFDIDVSYLLIIYFTFFCNTDCSRFLNVNIFIS